MTWNDAGALPASVEAAVGVLRQLGVARGETLLILGAAGSVGIIATQLGCGRGSRSSEPSARETKRSSENSEPRRFATATTCSPTSARSPTALDATFDAAGKGGLEDAIELAGGSGA